MTQNLTNGYPVPKTNEQEVLLTMIIHGNVTIFDYPWMSGFRTRVSQLQTVHKLNLDREMKKKQNKFGNWYAYAVHILPETERQKAIDLYYKINQA